MSQTWYRRLLYSYFPIILFAVSILVFISFLFVNEISRAETKKADRISGNYIVDSIERTLKDIEMGILEEVEKTEAYGFYLSGRNDQDSRSMYTVAQSLRKLSGNPEFVQSVYLYRNVNQTVLTPNGVNAVNDFWDKEFLNGILKGNTSLSGWLPVRNYQEERQHPVVRVISLCKSMPIPFGSEGMLVVNVKVAGLEQLMDTMVNSQISFMNITGADGSLIYSSHSDLSAAKQGKVLNTFHSNVVNWNFSSGIKNGSLFGWVSVITYIWVAASLGTVVCTIVYLVYITRKNYKPIQVIMNRLQSHQIRHVDNDKPTDEMKFIEGALENLISHTIDYDSQHKENLLLQRSRLFLDLLQSDRLEGIRPRLEQFAPVSFRGSQYAVMVTEINQYDAVFHDYYSRKDQNTLKFALMNVFQELARNAELEGWAEWISASRTAIIFTGSHSGEEMKERMRLLADHCRDWVRQNLRLSLSFGVGSLVSGYEDIYKSYEEAASVMQHKLLMGEDSIMVREGDGQAGLIKTYEYLQTITELVRDFRMANGNWRTTLERMFLSMEKDFLNDTDILSLVQALLHMLDLEVGLMSEEIHQEITGGKAEELQLRLEATKSIGELKEALMETLNSLFRMYISVSETKSYRALVSEIKDYIEQNFTNPDLSLKHLSDRFHISGKYASYLFKTEFNTKFVDFLMELRMKEAEKLLLSTDDSLTDIALKVGYANAITFGRVFKRITGTTPGDYRRKGQPYSG